MKKNTKKYVILILCLMGILLTACHKSSTEDSHDNNNQNVLKESEAESVSNNNQNVLKESEAESVSNNNQNVLKESEAESVSNDDGNNASTPVPALEQNTALVTYDGKTELFYLSHAGYEQDYYLVDTNRIDYDKFDRITFYHYDSNDQNDASIGLTLDTVRKAETGMIQTQDDAGRTVSTRRASVHSSFSTATWLGIEWDSLLVDNRNDYTIEFIEVVEPEKTYHIRMTYKPHNSEDGKTKDIQFEALFTIGEVHPVADSHGDAGNVFSAYKIRSDAGNRGGSIIVDPDNGETESENDSGTTPGTIDTKHICGGCNGAKKHVCPVCNGLKYCMSCDGTGIFNDRECSNCNGNRKCSNCNGNGEVKCSTCNGRGYRY